MKIARIEPREEQIMEKLRSRPRLEGRHLTDTVYCNVKAWAGAVLGALGETIEHDDATLLKFLAGLGMESILMEGQMAQIQTVSPDDDSVGTIDVWYRGRPVEIKVTYQTTRRDIGTNFHWLEQLGGYAARNIGDHITITGEFWVVHLNGDYGKKFCLEHGVPDEEFKRRHPDTGRPRLACPVEGCWVFLVDGNREITLRCHSVTWTREELESLHKILTSRQAQLKEDIDSSEYSIGSPPPIRWGYQEFECAGCRVKDRIGCPGIEGIDDLEEKLAGSIHALEQKELAKP